jgi:hypothetical protein
VREENRFYSHDHGWFFPPEGPTWTIADLEGCVDIPRELSMMSHSISEGIGDEIATKLHALSRAEIQNALEGIPVDWPVTDAELECIGYFLEKRAHPVAERIRIRCRRIT